MGNLETVFDINRILVTLFNTSEVMRKEKNIDLVYEMDTHVPKEFRGDSTVLIRLLTQMLTFVVKHTDRDEILLTLSAPEDFVFEEDISFKIKETGIGKEKILAYLETNLSRDLEYLGGKIIDEDEDSSDVSLSIPFKICELGFRRHYRLPDDKMLDKKVLISCESAKISNSLKKLFQYFHYEVDLGLDAFKENGSDLGKYDIFLTEAKLCEGEVGSLVLRSEEIPALRLVLLKGKEKVQNSSIRSICSYLSKPITQESVYKLIVTLFNQEVDNVDESVKKQLQQAQSEPEIVIEPVKKDAFRDEIEEKRHIKFAVLNMELGQNNAQKQGLVYHHELKVFLETFNRSDLYFRQIVNEKASNKIKEFCIDLERQSKSIGAESMLNFANTISLIFIHDKLDLLPIYPGRYHIELKNLIAKIKETI